MCLSKVLECTLSCLLCPLDSPDSSSGGGDTGSDDDDQEVGGEDMSKLQEMEMAMGTGLSQDAISKAKQSKSERKARKTMQKLGLKHIDGI